MRDPHGIAHNLRGVAQLEPNDRALGIQEPADLALHGVSLIVRDSHIIRAEHTASPSRLSDGLRNADHKRVVIVQCSSSWMVTMSNRTTSPNQPQSPHQVMKLRVSLVQYSVAIPPSASRSPALIGQNLGRSSR